MNVIESINNINEAIQEADIAVVESMISIIDKREMFVECNNDTLDEMFMESMEWFLESKNRERDRTPRNDITKWMDENGYWYTGDNPKKKKECNRMYHFLQQHDFDPETETIKTDITFGGSEPKRVKLNIDQMVKITDSDKKLMQELTKKYGEKNDKGKTFVNRDRIPWDEYKKGPRVLFDKYDLNSEIKNEKNAAYNINNDSINISSKILKDKQPQAQFIGKHEEGHGYVNHVGNALEDNPDIATNDDKKRMKEFNRIAKDAYSYNKKYRNKGVNVNIHDINPEENVADAYAVKNARKRTKNWGKNKETKKLDSRDILRIFKSFTSNLKDIDNSLDAESKILDDTIKYLHELLSKDWSLDIIRNSFELREIVKYNKELNNTTNAVNKLIPELEKVSNNDLFREYYEKSQALREKYKEIKNSQNVNDEELQKLTDECDNFSVITGLLADTMFKDDPVSALKASANKNIDRLNDYIKSYSSRLSDDKKTSLKDVKTYKNNVRFSIDKKLLEKIDNEANGDINKALKIVKSYYSPSIKRWIKSVEKIKQNIVDMKKDHKDIEDISTQLRYEIAAKYVEEYFTELFDDMYIAE